MRRDSRVSRRNWGKDRQVEEIENVPINTYDLSSFPTGLDPSRAPLRSISHPSVNPKACLEQTGSVKRKHEATPTKGRGKNSDTAPLSTPERQTNGNFSRKRLAFSSVNECHDDGQSDMGNYMISQSARNVTALNLTPRVGGRVYRGHSERETASALYTPARAVSKPLNPGLPPMSSLRHPGSAHVASYGALPRRFSVSSGQSSTVNTVEVPHFDLKEDPSFWMDHNVQVVIRVRPLNSFEINSNGYNRCVKQENAQCITWIGQPETRFTFDHVACETVDQEILFRMTGLPMVENCLSGYNSCMFAYGQTGSGKTYTMLGETEDLEFKPSSHRGMTPRIFEFLFARISAEEESRRDEKLKYSCKCSFLEIYNEQIIDLLDPTSTNLQLREDVKKGVYVENLSEFEVHSVSDVLRLLIQGSSNRKVAATDMNRESSRSHSVFTCIIESRWERDSTTNLRFARLNLVDLAGSERQKLSGAEGERLKEAANINKSLSTLGHVIMLLVDIAQGKTKHVPYRDSRLTFLLQDSLGGNSKTMIIANVSPSLCCAAETLNTLKFAQRAKLIQNNAVINEDSSGDVAALQQQIWLLKEELAALKRQNVSRCLAFDPPPTAGGDESTDIESRTENDMLKADSLLRCQSEGNSEVSTKQLKPMDEMLAGALRREQIAETSIKQLEAEIEHLNSLVHQREEDTRCTKMMLKFREDKIQRMESLSGDLKPVDEYLMEENAALLEEIQLLKAKVDKNPEVTRFASENIRLQEQLRRFQDFYEEGERYILMNEVSELRSQLIQFLDNDKQLHNSNADEEVMHNTVGHMPLNSEVTNTLIELDECQSKLKSCLESNAKKSREVEYLRDVLRNKGLHINDHNGTVKALKVVEVPRVVDHEFDSENCRRKQGIMDQAELILNLELELDILKILLKEERLSRQKMEDTIAGLIRDAHLAEERLLVVREQCEGTNRDLKEAKSVIEALESQHLLSINEIDDLKKCNGHYLDKLHKQDVEISALKEQIGRSRFLRVRDSEVKESPMQVQLKKMQASLDKAKRLNMWCQSDNDAQRSNEEEMDEIRQQAEAETAEVIVSLQEELSMLQHRVQQSDLKEREAENKLLVLETQVKELQETLDSVSHDNELVQKNLHEKDMEIKSLTEDWEILSSEIEGALLEGNETLASICDQFDSISCPFSDRRSWISEQVSKMIRQISEKESIIQNLNDCLEDAKMTVNDMDHKLLYLRGAAVMLNTPHGPECYEKDNQLMQLRSELLTKTHAITELERRMKLHHNEMMKTSTCATAAFVVINRLSEIISSHVEALKIRDTQLRELQEYYNVAKSTTYEGAQRKFEALETSIDNCSTVDERQKNITMMQRGIEENDKHASAKSTETAEDHIFGVSRGRSSMNECTDEIQYRGRDGPEIMSDLFNGEMVHEFDFVDAKSTPDPKMAEPYGLPAEFEEAQDRMKDVGAILNEQKENETLKLEIGNIKKINDMLTSEKDSLVTEIQELQSSYEFLDQNYKNLEKQFEQDVSKFRSFVEELERSFSEAQSTSEEALLSFAHGFKYMKFQVQNAVRLMHSSLEELSSEILVKDCALSVSNLCQTGALLDAVMGLESENGDLHIGIHKSNAVISNLREHNMKLKEELDTYGMLRGKLLADVTSNFECVSRKEGETRELSMKLSCFKEKLEILQCQEELMLERSDIMSSELAVLMEKLHEGSSIVACLSEQEKLLRSNDEEMKSQAENFFLEMNSKDFELLVMSSELQQLAFSKSDIEQKVVIRRSTIDYSTTHIIALMIETDLREQLMLEREHEIICLQTQAEEAKKSEAKVLHQLQELQEEYKTLKEYSGLKETENESFKKKLQDMQTKNCTLLEGIQEKDVLKLQKCRLENDISICESKVACLEEDLKIKEAEHDETIEALRNKCHDLEACAAKVSALQEENLLLRDELLRLRQCSFEALQISSCNANCIKAVVGIDLHGCRMLEKLDKNLKLLLHKISQNACQNLDVVSSFLQELEFVDSRVRGLVADNLTLQEELFKKDEVLNTLMLELRCLQESTAISKNQKAEIEKLAATLKSTEGQLAIRTQELDEAIARSQELGVKVKEQTDKVTALDMKLEKANQSLMLLSDESMRLKSHIEEIKAARTSVERELTEKRSVVGSLENELVELGKSMSEMNDLVESLKTRLVEVTSEKDQLQKQVVILEENVKTAHALAEESEAIAAECEQIAESRRIYAEEKEEEMKLLEGSVLELGSTISALENKVEMLREETAWQKEKREVLKSELHSLKKQMHTNDADIKRHLEEKAKNLQEALGHIKVVEEDLEKKDREIADCNARIKDLNVRAERQESRLHHAQSLLLQVMEELFQYRAASGAIPSVSFTDLLRLNKKSKGSEKEKVFQKLLDLASSFQKFLPQTASVTKPTSRINHSADEDAKVRD